MPVLDRFKKSPASDQAPATITQLPPILDLARRADDPRLVALALDKSHLLSQQTDLQSAINEAQHAAQQAEKHSLSVHAGEHAGELAKDAWEYLAALERKVPFLQDLILENDAAQQETIKIIALEAEQALRGLMIDPLETIIEAIEGIAPALLRVKFLAGKSATIGKNSSSYYHLCLDLRQWTKQARASLEFLKKSQEESANG